MFLFTLIAKAKMCDVEKHKKTHAADQPLQSGDNTKASAPRVTELKALEVQVGVSTQQKLTLIVHHYEEET